MGLGLYTVYIKVGSVRSTHGRDRIGSVEHMVAWRAWWHGAWRDGRGPHLRATRFSVAVEPHHVGLTARHGLLRGRDGVHPHLWVVGGWVGGLGWWVGGLVGVGGALPWR